MVKSSVSPDKIIGVKFVVLNCLLEQVQLRKHEYVVLVELKCNMIPFRKIRVLQFLTSKSLNVRLKPLVLKFANLLEYEYCIMRVAPLPDELIKIFVSKDYEIGVSQQQKFKVF